MNTIVENMTGRRYTKDEIKLIGDLSNEGLLSREIAQRLGRSEQGIRSIRRRHYVPKELMPENEREPDKPQDSPKQVKAEPALGGLEELTQEQVDEFLKTLKGKPSEPSKPDEPVNSPEQAKPVLDGLEEITEADANDILKILRTPVDQAKEPSTILKRHLENH